MPRIRIMNDRAPARIDLNRVDLNLLRVFDAVLRDGNVTLAGGRLGLSQPAVSNALARLRRLFDDALFVRAPEGMRPTARARKLAEPIRQALGLIETTLLGSAGFDPATSERPFRFYMSDIGEMVFLPPLLERLHEIAPGLRIETLSIDEPELPEALASGELDLAIGFLPGVAGPVKSRRLFRDPYACLFRADHPRIGKSLTRKVFEASSHALVASIGSGHRVVEEALFAHGLNRRIALRVPHFMVLPMILERTDLVVTVPSRAARVFGERGALRWLPAPVPIPLAEVKVFWHERFEADEGNRWLRELVVALYAR
jgi:DNA-binding transcriptional LysR family regulator